MAEGGGNLESLTVTLMNIQHLRGHKADSVQVTVKIEFGEKILGESGKIDCSSDTTSEINYSAQMMVASDDPLALDDLVSKPIVCTVIEVLPKEKKQKEEKTAILGQCAVDIRPVLTGESQNKQRMQIVPSAGSPLDNLPSDHPKPELEVQLNLSDSIIKELTAEETNIVSITIESLFAPPESWNMSPSLNYVAATPLPISGEKDNIVVFTGGQVKPGYDKEIPNKRLKWAMPGAAQGAAVYIGDEKIASDPIEDQSGDLKAPDEQEFRRIVEHEKLHVSWNLERRCFLDSSSAHFFKERIAKSRYHPVEIFRTMLPAAGRPKARDDDAINFHGIAFVDVSPLLYPGVKRIRGAFKVTAFGEHELFEKTDRRFGIAEEAVRIANGVMMHNTSPTSKLSMKKDDLKSLAKLEKKQASSLKPVNEGGNEVESVQQVNVEGMHYVEAKSYLMIEIELHRPLIRKKEAAELATRISELAPPRPLFPKKTNSAQKAVCDFHNQVGIIANLLLDEFRDQLNSSHCSYQQNSSEEKRQKLLYDLNASGKYLAFKEQLKFSVVKIVREKYLKTSNFQDNNQLQAFLSELYVYLIDEMHVGLGKILAIEDQKPVPCPLTDSVQLKHFAREAEVNGNFDLAAKFYQERIARDRNDPDHWLDYGTFCIYVNDLPKAEECFRECLSVDQCHLHGLLLNGIICSMLERNESAETFFQAATTYWCQSILSWTIFGLFYLGIGNEINADMALAEANRLNIAAASADLLPSVALEAETPALVEGEVRVEDGKINDEVLTDQSIVKFRAEESKLDFESEKSDRSKKLEKGDGKVIRPSSSKTSSGHMSIRSASKEQVKRSSKHKTSLSPGLKKSGKMKDSLARATISEEPSVALPAPDPPVVPSQTIYMQAIEFLLDVRATSFTERALAQHLTTAHGGLSAKYHISLARLKIQKNCLDEAETHVKNAMQEDHQCPDAWALMGHVKYLTGDIQEAKSCYERTLAFVADASEMHSIYLRLASIYLQEGQFQSARDTFLMACRCSPSCVSWLGVGIACYRLCDLTDAEDALTEANILDNMDPEVWAYLCLICLHTGRQLEAEQAYKYALKLNLQDMELLAEINQLQEDLGFGNPQY